MQNIWLELSKAISCGGCGETTTIESPHTCGKCGRMLCGSCGVWCKDHAPNKVLHPTPESGGTLPVVESDSENTLPA